jgi:hypothetical protein
MKIKTAARKYNLSAREVVAFIRNRHCSRVSLNSSLADATDKAESYGTHEEKITSDIEFVGNNGDLGQYIRNSQPYSKQ